MDKKVSMFYKVKNILEYYCKFGIHFDILILTSSCQTLSKNVMNNYRIGQKKLAHQDKRML